MAERDALYRRLFQHHQLLRDLLACVLADTVVNTLDWSGLQALDTQYVGDRLQRRQGDGAWRIPLRSGQSCRNVYVLLMLENQSRPDAYMALRMATYTGLLYQSLLRQKETAAPLSPVLPVVLYSGRRHWRASRDMAELVEPVQLELSPYQLRQRYILVDQAALLRQGRLLPQNLATVLFRLEHSRSIEEIAELLHTLRQVVKGPEHEELERSFSAYIRHLVLMRAQPAEPVRETYSLQELSMMISEKPGLWARQWKKEGVEEGRQEGRQEGLRAGRTTVLKRLLLQKFGHVPDQALHRIEAADAAELEAWTLRILDAERIDDIFR